MVSKSATLIRQRLAPFLLPAFLVTTASMFAGCYFDASEGGHDNPKDPWATDDATYSTNNYWPPSLSSEATVCDKTSPGSTCYRQDDFTWRTSCKSAECQSVEVFVHYMLTEDLGSSRVIHVEAFDNGHFSGAPVSSVALANFRATTGNWEKAKLFLEPGQYYLRAYLADEDSAVVPYELAGMALIADQPVGVLGALSSAEAISIAPRSQVPNADPVHIYLEKLLRKPGSEVDTKAHLRIAFSVAAGSTLPDDRQVMIQLRDTPDLSFEPMKTFTMSTSNLLVQGRVGHADFVSQSLPVGSYFIYAFLDANGNGLHDGDEMAALYAANGEAKIVKIEANRTTSVALELRSQAAVSQESASR